MSAQRRIGLSQLLPAAVSAGALVWLLRDVDLPAVAAAVDARVAIVMIPALVAFCAVTLWIEAMSIHRMVTHPPPDFGLWSAARIKCASYLPGLIHYTLGVGGLAVLLRRRTALPLGEALGMVLLISSTDLLIVLTAAGTSAAILGVGHRGVRTGLVALVIAAFFAGITLVRSPASLGALERVRGLSIFESLRRVPLARLGELLTLRALFSACFVAGCASAFAAFEIAPPPARLIGGIMIVALVAALPIAVAGLGTSQAAFVYLFADDRTRRAAARDEPRAVVRDHQPARRDGALLRPRAHARSAPGRRADRRGVSQVRFTGERLHDDLALFALDLARHRAAYEFARERVAGRRVLDLGCGSGSGAALLAALGRARARRRPRGARSGEPPQRRVVLPRRYRARCRCARTASTRS